MCVPSIFPCLPARPPARPRRTPPLLSITQPLLTLYSYQSCPHLSVWRVSSIFPSTERPNINQVASVSNLLVTRSYLCLVGSAVPVRAVRLSVQPFILPSVSPPRSPLTAPQLSASCRSATTLSSSLSLPVPAFSLPAPRPRGADGVSGVAILAASEPLLFFMKGCKVWSLYLLIRLMLPI